MKLIISDDRIAASALDSYQAPPGVTVIDAPADFSPERMGDYRVVGGALILPIGQLVNAERDRRLALGFNYDFGDERGIHRIGTTAEDNRGWDEVTKLAQALINGGQAGQTITILTDTGPTTVTAAEWQSILLAAAAFRQPIWAASFALASMVPIPADFADDSYWP